MTKSFIPKIIKSNGYMTTSSLNIYNYTYIQSALLNLSTRDKQYYVVIINPDNYKENMKIYNTLLYTNICK